MDNPETGGPFKGDGVGGRARNLAEQYLKEFTIFVGGILLGFFWHLYYIEDRDSKVHIIIGLVVITTCMTRYIMLMKQQRDEGSGPPS